MPSQEEMDEGKRNLEENDYTVDYIVSYCWTTSLHMENIKRMLKQCILKKFDRSLTSRDGSLKNINVEEIMLYEQIIRIS